jgi:neutral amino acid transport system ATP-binding protein
MLRCTGVRKAFGGVLALDDVTLQFPSTGLVAIMGPNGAGKTTLFHILSGFLKPDAGHCFLDEREITHFPAYRIAGLGVVRTFQDLRFISRMTALDNVLLACPRQSGEKLIASLVPVGFDSEEQMNHAAALNYLRCVGLEEKASDAAAELSYGEQKLLTIACCLATQAQTLLLDEPVAGVHPEIAGRILSLLNEFRQRGKLIVFIEHDLQTVAEASELVVVMDHGRIIAQGESRDVIGRREIMEAYVA